METPPASKVHWLNLRYTDQQCPGMHEIFAMAPKDQQSALVRGILYQWCLEHQHAGTLMQAIISALNGPGVKGKRGLRRSTTKKRAVSQAPALNHAQANTTDSRNAQATASGHASSSFYAPPPTATAQEFAKASIPALAPLPSASQQTGTAPVNSAEPTTVQDDRPPPAGTAADALFDMYD